jgi:8-oxo-dGTP diphosphatase
MPEKNSACHYPRASVAVVVTYEDRVLFGQRKHELAHFLWQLPGGWMKNGESPESAARREVKEETGLILDRLDFVAVTNNVFSALNHSISLCFEAECRNPTEIVVKEPEKCLGWHWQKWCDVEDNLFLPLAILKKSDYRPFIRDKRGISVSF